MRATLFKIFFLFLLSIISPILAKDACVSFIYNLRNYKYQPAKWTSEMKDYFAFSGKEGTNLHVQKKACELKPKRKFLLISELEQAGKKVHEIGICLPSYCHQGTLGSQYNELATLCMINGWAPRGTLVLSDLNSPKIKGGSPSPQAKDDSLARTKDGSSYRNKGYYVLIFIFYALIGLCLISTIVQIRHRVLKVDTNKIQVSWLWKSFDVVGNVKSLYTTAAESGQSDHLAIFGFLRFLAAIRIIGFHCLLYYRKILRPHGLWPDPEPWTIAFFTGGWSSVGHFFFIGGFLAAFTLIGKASKEGTGTRRFFSDIMHRLFKIYPGFLTCILAYMIFFMISLMRAS